jgi:hypothetical protein
MHESPHAFPLLQALQQPEVPEPPDDPLHEKRTKLKRLMMIRRNANLISGVMFIDLLYI